MRKVKVELPKSHENDWAFGCPKCKYGIVAAPELTRACDLHMERLVQAITKQIEFCDCKAGIRYHVYLKNRWRMLIEEARRMAPKDNRMLAAAGRQSHPDIEIAMHAIEKSYAMLPAPTVHAAQPVAAEPQGVA